MADDTGSALIDQLLAANPDLATQLMGGTEQAQQTGPLMGGDLYGALIGSAMDVTGRYGQTGRDYRSGSLPSWAQGLSQQVYESPDFDPYYGVVSQQGDERVYWGEQKARTVTPGGATNKFASDMGGPEATGPETTLTTADKTLTAIQAQNMPYTWDEDEVDSAMQKMREAGVLTSTANFDDLVQAWGGLVSRAATTYAMSEGNRKVTPWDVLDLYKNEAEKSGLLDKMNGSRTTVSRNITEVDEGEAWSSLQSTLSSLLGKDPSDQETRDFTYRMGQLAARNPSISKTVTQYKDGEATGSTTRTRPGFTAADMAKEAYDGAQDDPEYGEYRSASYYFNAAMGALGPIGG